MVHRSLGSISEVRLVRDASESTERAITCFARAGETLLLKSWRSSAVNRLGGLPVAHEADGCGNGGIAVGVEALEVS